MMYSGGDDDERDDEEAALLLLAGRSNPQDDSVASGSSRGISILIPPITTPEQQNALGNNTTTAAADSSTHSINSSSILRSRNAFSNIYNNNSNNNKETARCRSEQQRERCLQRQDETTTVKTTTTTRCCCRRTTMNTVASVLLWLTVICLAVATVWYSYELFNHGTDPHLIAWFSAGAFVLLGFPISMYGIIGHLANYNAPAVQVYVIRILWMVPIYSVESWLAMRFHKQAVFIETLRDFYESYVLYSFTQFLIEVLGGEEALILMLKDKSPTRGHHMWGLQWCVKPWLMGQPVRRLYDNYNQDDDDNNNTMDNDSSSRSLRNSIKRVAAAIQPAAARQSSRVHWKSPFFVKCKFGVLQYVLIKFLCAVAVLILEYYGWYKEGQFHWNAGYLYICIITNVSQCWALYCLIFFYYATKTELSPIRPVGKFLSVKALVFFTWWQSVFISVLYQMDMIPNYRGGTDERDWSSDAVAKGIQDYLICMEMFVAAVVHTFVFPHSEYSVAAVRARQTAVLQKATHVTKRLGRRKQWKDSSYIIDHNSNASASSSAADVEMASLLLLKADTNSWDDGDDHAAEDPIMMQPQPLLPSNTADSYNTSNDTDDDDSSSVRPGLFRAFMDSAIPRDLRDNTVNALKGEYNVEKKTLLHHAATSDQYDLFSKRRRKDHQQQRK